MATPGSNSFNTPNGFPQSTILGMTDMDAIRPDVSETLFNTYGDQYSSEFRLWMKLHGGMIQTKNPQGGRLFQETRYDDYAEVLANAGTAGTTLQFTLDTSQIYTIGSGFYVYPQIGDLISDMTTMTRGRITNVVVASGVSATITAVSFGANWVAPTPGKKYAIFSNSQVEASGDIKARIAYWFSKSYQIQILREKADTTDLASGAQLFPVKDQLGNATQYWGSVAYMQMEKRLHKQIYNTVWLGSKNTVAGQPTTTTGYYDEFSTQANSVNVGSGDYVQAFFDLNDALLENSPMVKNYWVIIKRNLNNEMQTDLNDYFDNLNIVRAQKETAVYLFGNEGATEGMKGLFDFNTLIFNGTAFTLHNDKAGYDPNVQGLDPTSSLFANTGYVMPTKTSTDAQGQISRNCMLRYFAPKNINLVGPQKIYHFQLGGLATIPTNANLNVEDHAVVYIGAQFYNLPQCGFLHKNVGS